MQPDSNPELTGQPLAVEIRLLGDLVLAASQMTRHLTQAELDQVLTSGSPVLELLAATGCRRSVGRTPAFAPAAAAPQASSRQPSNPRLPPNGTPTKARAHAASRGRQRVEQAQLGR